MLNKKRKHKYPHIGDTMKTAMEVAEEMNVAKGRQLEAERQNRSDIAILQKTRFEALLWVLGKDYATPTIR
jgi:hypothetical protein